MPSNTVSVVLVHAAWADGSCWAGVISELSAKGIAVSAPPLPLTTFEDDVKAVERALERMPGDVVLVGHAYSGAVISAVTSGKVKGLAYVAGLTPDGGEPVLGVFTRVAPHPQAPKIEPDEHGLVYLPGAAFAAAFAQDATVEEQAVLAAVQKPVSPACITVPVSAPLWKKLPSWYLVAEHDRMIPSENQYFMATRMKAVVRSHSVDHVPMVTAPDVVVELIEEAIAGVKSLGHA